MTAGNEIRFEFAWNSNYRSWNYRGSSESFIEHCPKETRTGLGSSSITKARSKRVKSRFPRYNSVFIAGNCVSVCDLTFPMLIIHGYLKKKNIKKKASMTFNVVISKGFLLPTVR